MFNVIWSDFASDNLKNVFVFHKEVAGVNVAHRLRKKILSSTKQLKIKPLSGQIVLSLEYLKEGHRYLVIGNYKIIYKIIGQIILITDLFDTRQEPMNINDPKRKGKK